MAEEKNKKIKHEIFERLREYCPKGYVTRKELQKLTGGSFTISTLSQLDYEGRGIANRKIVGATTVYEIDDVIQWLEENTELIGFGEDQSVKKSLMSIDELLLAKRKVNRRIR